MAQPWPGRDARGQALLVDILFWVTVVIVAGALVGNWLGIMGYIQRGATQDLPMLR